RPTTRLITIRSPREVRLFAKTHGNVILVTIVVCSYGPDLLLFHRGFVTGRSTQGPDNADIDPFSQDGGTQRVVAGPLGGISCCARRFPLTNRAIRRDELEPV